MNSFILAFNVVCPLFLMMILGYFLKMLHIFDDLFLRKLNTICFQVFLPMLLFINVYQSNFKEAFQPELILFAVGCVCSIFVVLMIVVPKIEKNNNRRGIIIQGTFRSNYILFGLPIASSLFGETNTGTTAILIAFVVPLYNVLSVIALEVFRMGNMNGKRILLGIIKNPLIIAGVFAFAFIGCGIQLPMVVEKTMKDIASIATPLALIILGGSFAFSKIGHNIGTLTLVILCKLVLLPLAILSVAILLGYKGMALGALLAMACSPTAVSSFTMAQQMGGDDELAGQIVVVSSLLSVVTIFMWISILHNFLIIT
ncbi:MAG: AEC family transporter [Longicatena sp.]